LLKVLAAAATRMMEAGQILMEHSMSPKYDQNNIFARMLRGELPCEKVYEDNETLAVMDIAPRSRGHVLVIPKLPSRNLLDADPSALAAALLVAQKIAKAAMKAFSADGVMLVQFSEAPAGQSVFHLHFHVIPRYDGEQMGPPEGPMEDNKVLAANAEKIRAALWLINSGV
jgi:histidine triad (HIT) family protein